MPRVDLRASFVSTPHLKGGGIGNQGKLDKMLKVTLPDGNSLEYSRRVRAVDVAADIGARLAKATLAAEVDGQLVGADYLLPEEGEVTLRLITKRDPEALGILRHSCAHVMARAVMRLFEGVQLAFGPTVDNGFYYDFSLDHSISEADFPKIEAEMARIIKEDEPFERVEEPRDQAIQLCKDLGQALKVEHLEEGLAEEGTVSFYRQGEFLDLCRGPHVPGPKAIGAFKLLSVAGAYWKGDASREQLQRLYGTAWFSKQDLKEYLERLEEAKRRDHRVLGKQLELFTIDPMVGSGLVLWLPKGAVVRRQLENFIYDELTRRGYQPVYTPAIGKVELYETSGHYPYYSDSQFPPVEMSDGDRFLLRPMNCPHHIMVYQSKPRSYRDLPLRLAELGLVHRFEQSGELSGMTRVRGFTQDDAHIFCTEEQVADEFRGCMEMTQFLFKTLGLEDYRVRLSFRDPASGKYVGSPEVWDRAESALEEVCRGMDLPEPGDRGWRGGLLRPQGRLRGQRLHRPRVAVGYRAVGLQPAQPRPVRPGVHRCRQPAASAGDDPPGAVGVDGAVRGHVDRALRRRLPALACARAGPGAGRQPEVRGVRPGGRAAVARGGAPRVGRLSGGEDRGEDPRCAVGTDTLHARGGRARTGGRYRLGPRPAGGRPRRDDRAGRDREAPGRNPR